MNFVYNTKFTRTLIKYIYHITTHRKRVPPIFVLAVCHRKIKKKVMYAYTVGSLSHEVDKGNIIPLIEHSARGAEKSSTTKPDKQLDLDCCISKSHLTFLV